MTQAAIHNKHFSQEAVASLVSQLRRIISYWDAKETKVEKIILWGDVINFTGLKTNVTRGLSVPLIIGHIQPDISIVTKAISPGMVILYASSIGAVLRIVKSPIEDRINFIPNENRMRLEKKELNQYIRIQLWHLTRANALVLIVLAIVCGFLWINQLKYEKNIIQTERFVSNHPAQKYIPHIVSTNAVAKQVASLIFTQKDIGKSLVYLSSVIPSHVRLTSVKMMSGLQEEWIISGTGNRVDILAMYYKLISDGKVKSVSMPYSNFDSETDTPFIISIIW